MNNCGNCRFVDRPIEGGPCRDCSQISFSSQGVDNWQPMDPPVIVQDCDTCEHENEPNEYEPCATCVGHVSGFGHVFTHWVQKGGRDQGSPFPPIVPEMLDQNPNGTDGDGST